jgi:regulatory protein
LRRAGLDDAAIDSVLEQLRRHGLVDDRAFAEYWVEQRQSFRPRGSKLLRSELAKLGVARGSADSVIAAAEPSAEADAYRAAGRYAARLAALDEQAFQSRLTQWLARRGFDWETISSVVARLLAERPTPEA